MRDGLVFSAQYAYVRARQLEGTFPGDQWSGTWIVTVQRVGHGWGYVPEQLWPYDTSVWPPIEPPRLDAIAKQYRLNTYYRRVRTVDDCKAAMALAEMPVMAALEITSDWHTAPLGRIPRAREPYMPIGTHSILLLGYNDEKQEFTFQNSWGVKWGDKGFGSLPYDLFTKACVETWVQLFKGKPESSQPKSHIVECEWGIHESTGEIVHGREIAGPNDERIAWSYAIERKGVLEVEELFVMPRFRRNGYGAALARAMAELSARENAHLSFLIPHADATSENLALIEKVLSPLGLQVRGCKERCASYRYETP
jgi:GNAT superfamily N-acetyltransferase